ncbi:hypothetical protein BLA29_013125 [Euroglyphus maynei]|uniref:Uncharacterized protein n=1 Tax=Euroglyphus maynei TaxID=6958 RepID=A0A1Y3AT03_EURMA|nr:hypothetical protein BLA29_013125 [Euroglyphus maynei]
MGYRIGFISIIVPVFYLALHKKNESISFKLKQCKMIVNLKIFL